MQRDEGGERPSSGFLMKTSGGGGAMGYMPMAGATPMGEGKELPLFVPLTLWVSAGAVTSSTPKSTPPPIPSRLPTILFAFPLPR